MRFGIPDIADVDEIRFFGHAKKLGYASVRVTTRPSCPRASRRPRGPLSDTPEPSDGSSHEVE